MATTQPTGTGVVGNTPSATQARAAQAASAARTATKADSKVKGVGYLIGFTIAVVFVFLALAYEWSFAWLLTAGILVFSACHFAGNSDSVKNSSHKELFAPWISFGKFFGAALVAGSLLTSSFFMSFVDTIDGTEEALSQSRKASQPGYVRRVKDTVVYIPESGFDRFIGVGSVDVINTGTSRCKSIEPVVRFYEQQATNLIRTFRSSDSHLLFTTTWTSGRVTNLQFSEPTEVNIITTAVGETMPSGNVCKKAW